MGLALEHSPNKTPKKQQKAFMRIVLFTTIVGSLVTVIVIVIGFIFQKYTVLTSIINNYYNINI